MGQLLKEKKKAKKLEGADARAKLEVTAGNPGGAGAPQGALSGQSQKATRTVGPLEEKPHSMVGTILRTPQARPRT